MLIITNCIKKKFRCKQNFRFVDLINVQFTIKFVNTFFQYIYQRIFEYCRNKFSTFFFNFFLDDKIVCSLKLF